MSDKPLTISVAARLAGVGIETIRYYQRIGLIDEPVKPTTGYRLYPAETIARIGFIQRAKQLGFSLKEITTLLELGDGHCSETRDIANHKLELIQEKIRDLRSMESALLDLVNACSVNPAHQGCPIISTITKI